MPPRQDMEPTLNMRKSGPGGLVYSTEGGRMCPVCRKPLAACDCDERARRAPAGDGVVRVSRETRGRGGKAVTMVRGLALDAAALAELGKRLRTACGAGGTAKDGVLEVQGDHCTRVVELLKSEGRVVKRAGG
jgi:translation initiation factor 1